MCFYAVCDHRLQIFFFLDRQVNWISFNVKCVIFTLYVIIYFLEWISSMPLQEVFYMICFALHVTYTSVSVQTVEKKSFCGCFLWYFNRIYVWRPILYLEFRTNFTFIVSYTPVRTTYELVVEVVSIDTLYIRRCCIGYLRPMMRYINAFAIPIQSKLVCQKGAIFPFFKFTSIVSNVDHTDPSHRQTTTPCLLLTGPEWRTHWPYDRVTNASRSPKSRPHHDWDESVSRLTQDQDSDRLIPGPRQDHDQTWCTRPLYYYLHYNKSHVYGDYKSKGGRCVYFLDFYKVQDKWRVEWTLLI